MRSVLSVVPRLPFAWIVLGAAVLLAGGCGGGGGGGGGGGATGPVVTITAPDDTATERTPVTDTGRFTVTRTGDTTNALNVSLQIAGTASNGTGDDFTEASLPATVDIPAGSASVDIDITPIDDVLVEGLETVEITVLVATTAYQAGTPATATVSILDNDTVVADISVGDANNLIQAQAGNPAFVILDVRTPAEFSDPPGHLQDAVNIDAFAADFADQIGALDRSGTYLVYCKAGARSATARDLMDQLNFAAVYNMLGGIDDWILAGYPTVTN